MSDEMNEFSSMSLVELVERAILHGSESDALLREAERRQEKQNQELAAAGKRPTAEWTVVAPVAWPPVAGYENVEMALCWRTRPPQAASPGSTSPV